MEKISAACAMEWSIQLEKALRSKNRARATEAIVQTGSRLEQWSQEPEAKQAVCSMFDLVPGEDRLFANTILLRLANAFRVGDGNIRKSIVMIFLSNYRKSKKKGGIKGILSKQRVLNHVELLERVKVVFETGDVESRALALVLFGCWADFAKDSAEIRYLVLSSLVSSSVLEVKASLFTVGCFCELVNDFAFVVLEMLVNVMSTLETAEDIRLAGARIFAHMTCSYSVACRAFKTGLRLVTESSEEKIISAILVSLSRLASKSTVLIPELVSLLLLYLNKEKSWQLREIALRCLHFIIVKEKNFSPVNENLIKTIKSTIEESELSSTMQCQTLQILHKIILYRLHDFLSLNTLDINQLLAIVENISRSGIMSNSFLALSFLADLSSKLWRRTKTRSDGLSPPILPSKVVSLIIERIFSLVKPLTGLYETNSRVFQEVKVLLNLLIEIVGESPDLAVLVLDKIISFTDSVVDAHGKEVATGHTGSNEIVLSGEERVKVTSKLLYYINRFVVACLQNLRESASITVNVSNKLKFLVDHLHQHGLFDFYIHTMFISLLHSQIVSHSGVNETKETFHADGIAAVSLNSHLFEHEFAIYEHAKKMLTVGDNWPAYKAGIYAASEGAWLVATFLFEQLTKKVKSDSFYCWLKSLVMFSHSEGKLRLFLLENRQSGPVDGMELDKSPVKDNITEVNQDAEGITSVPDYNVVLLEARDNICSSLELLEKIDISGKGFCFQRWFLALRARFLVGIVEVLEILSASKSNNADSSAGLESSMLIEHISSQKMSQISVQFKTLAEELDLISASFVGMDNDSLENIAALALICSVLAFTSAFPLFLSSFLAHETSTSCDKGNSLQNCTFSVLFPHVVGWLSQIDNETDVEFSQLFEDCTGYPGKHVPLRFRNQILSSGHETKNILSILKHAVSSMVCLRNEANEKQNEKNASYFTKKGLHLLSDVVMKSINIPFQAPKYFFKTRPCAGSELFAFNADTSNSNRITVMLGSSLSLNICIQLRNIPSESLRSLAKVYCLLYCNVSSQKPHQNEANTGTMQWNPRPWESNDLLEMNEKLLHHVTESTKKSNPRKRARDNDYGTVHCYVSFEPTVKGQGFSSCLLDVSHFPPGCYSIKWYSCCVDNQGCFWSLLPLNSGPEFTLQQSPIS